MLRIFFLLLAVVIGGWVAWPAYSAYQIYSGMKSADEGVLQRKINWKTMRGSLRPTVTREVEKAINEAGGKAGGDGLAGALIPQLKKKFMPKIVNMALQTVVTPKGLTEVMAHGGDVSATVQKIVSKQVGKMGGLGALTGGGSGGGSGLLGGLLGGGDAKKGAGGLLGGLLANKKVREVAGDKLGKAMGGSKKAAAKPSAKPSYGLGNIKRFAYKGPGTIVLGVAKDTASKKPDVTAVMQFQGFDWKLTRLVPRKR